MDVAIPTREGDLKALLPGMSRSVIPAGKCIWSSLRWRSGNIEFRLENISLAEILHYTGFINEVVLYFC